LSIATSPSTSGLVAGASSTVNLIVNALDPDGNTIIGPGSYVNSSGTALTLNLADSDTSGATNLSQTTVTAPTTGITLSYNGTSLGSSPVITLSATSLTSVNVTIKAYAAATVTDYSIGAAKVQVPTFLVVAQGDGNIWFSEGGAVAVGRLTPATPNPTITQFTGTEGNFDIINGPDHNLWVTVSSQSTASPAPAPPTGGNAIAKLTFPGPTVTQFPIPTSSSGPRFIASGSDGNMYFTECNVGQIARVTTAGVVTEFTIPSGSTSVPYDIVSGPDGNIWFTEMGASGGCTTTNTGAHNIGKLTLSPTPTITEFPTPTTSSEPRIIVSGPDGNLWFTEYGVGRIGQITTAGVVTEFTTTSAASNPFSIGVGPDSNLWFTEFTGNKIGKVTTLGAITEYTTSAGAGPVYFINGPDGALWFTENTSSKIGRITVSGQLTEYTTATASAVPAGLVLGNDNYIYFAEASTTVGRIGRVIP
jgi:streptogramin lyase